MGPEALRPWIAPLDPRRTAGVLAEPASFLWRRFALLHERQVECLSSAFASILV